MTTLEAAFAAAGIRSNQTAPAEPSPADALAAKSAATRPQESPKASEIVLPVAVITIRQYRTFFKPYDGFKKKMLTQAGINARYRKMAKEAGVPFHLSNGMARVGTPIACAGSVSTDEIIAAVDADIARGNAWYVQLNHKKAVRKVRGEVDVTWDDGYAILCRGEAPREPGVLDKRDFVRFLRRMSGRRLDMQTVWDNPNGADVQLCGIGKGGSIHSGKAPAQWSLAQDRLIVTISAK